MSQTSTTGPWYRQISRRQWKAFVAAWIGYLLDGFDFVIISLVLTEVIAEFDLTVVQGASLVSAAFISRWFGGLALGAVADRFGRRDAMVLSIVLFCVGSVICALAPHYLVLFAARILIGLGMAGEYTASSTYVIESWPEHLRNKASGFLISGFSIGTVLSAQAYDLIVPTYGWRALFAAGLVPIAVAIWLRRSLPESDDWTEARRLTAGDAPPADMFSILFKGPRAGVNVVLAVATFVALVLIFTSSIGSAWLVVVLAVLVAGVFVSFMTQFEGSRWPTGVTVMITVFAAFLYSWPIQALLPTYLKTDLGLDTGRVADVLFFAGFGAAVGCVVAGFLGDAIGTRRAYWIALVVSEVLVFPVFLVTGDHLVLLGGLLFLQQVFGQGISGLLPKWIGGYFTVDKRAAGLGFSYNVGALGGAVAPVLGAALASRMSLGTSLATFSFGLTLVVIVLVGTNAPLRVQRLLRPAHARPEDALDRVPRPTTTAATERQP